MKNKFIIEDEIVKIELTNKKGEIYYSLIDLDDLEKVKTLNLSWHLKWNERVKQYYCKATKYLGLIGGKPKYKTVYLHRVIMNAEDGHSEIPDHINHNTLDNRKSNLKIKDNQNNSINRKGRNSNNVSGERNVSWSKTYNKWLVQLQVNGKNTLFGKFDFEDLEKAKELAKQKRKELYIV